MPAVRAAAGAVAFLTRVPVGRFVTLDAADVARGALLFPVIGLVIGAAVGGAAAAPSGPLTATLAAALAVALGAALTGALHLDGVADTADALGASTRERALEIMRDHQIGAYGAVALVLDLTLKIAAISVLASRGDALRLVACSTAIARVVPVLLGVALPYARARGTGGLLTSAGRPSAAAALLIGIALCFTLGAPWLAVVLVVAAVVCGTVARAWLGGVTGDVLGASAEVTEIAALVVAVALT
jgi:adenosylcobinamide-GDP ribazoletransferase